ncbi:MAG TPA: hydantoinase/oxoprolinase family protein [Steroidobacteraceae bacterium]|nr:hydantoinase/oxoprolinase family protein [Steroidobacteraceae bacterium]
MIRLAIDIGGTFTDFVLDTGRRYHSLKLLTTPGAPEEAVIQGAIELLARARLRPRDLGLVIHGTTLATNAIIERKGANVGLVATEGFRDVLAIADEGRFDQYDIFLVKPAPLVPRERRFTVAERVDARGEVLRSLEAAEIDRVIDELERAGIESVAVALLHGYANPRHELAIGKRIAERLPRVAVSLASEVCPEIREYERTSTTVANAYVQPVMAGYLRRLALALGKLSVRCPFYLMTSGGGLTTLDAAIRHPVRLIESGPAGGAILASGIARSLGREQVLSFDMGGTTAKICLIDHGQPESSRSFEVDRSARFMKGSGLPLRIPVIEMVEIGAGGGSIASIDALGRLKVGPESAGSSPGPACYAMGGEEPAVTDANVHLGRIDPERFAAGRLRLDRSLATRAIEARIAKRLGLAADAAALGIAEIVEENMTAAARTHAAERGKDASGRTLIAFGGGAPLHAARLAAKLGIDRIVLPAFAGVGSAFGFLLAPIAFEVVRSRYMSLDGFDAAGANRLMRSMHQQAKRVVLGGAGRSALRESRAAYMRYLGQGHEIVVSLPIRALAARDRASLRLAFERRYRELFGRIIPDAGIEILTWSLSLTTAVRAIAKDGVAARTRRAKPAAHQRVIESQGRSARWPVYWRAGLEVGTTLVGPALIAEDDTTTVVPAGFTATTSRRGHLLLERRSVRRSSR